MYPLQVANSLCNVVSPSFYTWLSLLLTKSGDFLMPHTQSISMSLVTPCLKNTSEHRQRIIIQVNGKPKTINLGKPRISSNKCVPSSAMDRPHKNIESFNEIPLVNKCCDLNKNIYGTLRST
jgi:hypothetical protein